MKFVFITLSLVLVAFIILFFILGIMSKSGKAPGLVEGALSKCPATPNCVCSEYQADSSHFIDPISIPQNIAFDPLPILENVIRDMGGSIQAETGNYVAATFTSAIFGFVDDLEIRIDPTQRVIHIRSASRVGYGDAGVNKKRTELLKNLFINKVSGAN
jgi:uncharacterized protein (DUF1499 family)